MNSNPIQSSSNRYLSEFLELPEYPVRKAGILFEKNLREYRLVLNLLQETLNSLKTKDLSKFDPTVGENACQIRAFRIAEAISNGSLIVRPELEQAIVHAMEKIDTLTNPESKPTIDKKAVSPTKTVNSRELFAAQNIDISLTEEEQFAYTSYVLTIGREQEGVGKETETLSTSPTNSPAKRIEQREHNELLVREVAKPTFLKQFSEGDEISNKFTTNFVAKAREILSQSSVRFVHDEAINLKDHQLIKMTSEEFQVMHQSRWPCLPMFWTYKTLCKSAEKQGLPIKIQVRFIAEDKNNNIERKQHVLFAVNGKNGYEVVPPDSEWSFAGKPAVCFSGIARASTTELPTNEEWKAHISLHKLDLIFAGAADHRQYPDETQDKIVLGLEDLEKYKRLAHDQGFCLENPRMFFIQHVYPITI